MLREEVWPYKDIWGDPEERKRVRDYLKQAWEDNTTIWVVETNLENVREEKDEMLTVSSSPSFNMSAQWSYACVQWWWRERYGQVTPLDTSNVYFGDWLYQQYIEASKFTTIQTNAQVGRNY